MSKDILVNEPVKRKESDESLIERIERELRELSKKKKEDMEQSKLKEEIEMIENHIKNALQLQMISVNLAFQYRERLKKASVDRQVSSDDNHFFKLNEIPEMIEERRRRKKLRDEAEVITKKIRENPDYCPTSHENEILNNWSKEEKLIQQYKNNKADEKKEIEKGQGSIDGIYR